MAPMPWSAQICAISSGSDAPWRKLKAERACSSTYMGGGEGIYFRLFFAYSSYHNGLMRSSSMALDSERSAIHSRVASGGSGGRAARAPQLKDAGRDYSEGKKITMWRLLRGVVADQVLLFCLMNRPSRSIRSGRDVLWGGCECVGGSGR